MGIGKKLSEILDEKGVNPNELAEKTGISSSTIYSIIKRDNTKINIQILLKICKELGVSAEVFYEDYISEKEKNKNTNNHFTLTDEEIEHLKKYNMLNDLGKQRLNERLDELLELPKYQKGKSLRKISEILGDHAYIAADQGGVIEVERDPNLPKISELIDKKYLK